MQLAHRSKPSKRSAAPEYLHVTSSKLPRPLTFIYQPKPNRTRAGNDANPMFFAPYHQLFMANLQAGFESPVFTVFPVDSNGLNTTPQHAVHWHATLDFLGKRYMSDEYVHYDSEQGARMNVAVKAWTRYNQFSFRDMWMSLFETNDEELAAMDASPPPNAIYTSSSVGITLSELILVDPQIRWIGCTWESD